MDNRHHPFDVIFGSVLGMLLAWMAYRQYFPPIARTQSGRPYSIAEFASEKDERANPAYTSATTYPSKSPDLELGTRQRPRRSDIPGFRDAEYRDVSTDGEDDHSRMAQGQVRDPRYAVIPESSQGGLDSTSFEQSTEYRR
jgi:hypothetical protein